MSVSDIVRAAFDRATEYLFPEAGVPVVLAVSGGADSMALLDLAVQARLWPLHVFHLNHGLRDGADADLEVVGTRIAGYRRLPGVKTIKVHGAVENIKKIAQKEHQGVEEAGRNTRYKMLKKLAKECGAPVVATAHHHDDQVETVLGNILRGSGPVGQAGMPPRRKLGRGIDLVRPLLELRHQDLCSYLSERNLDWIEDPTNDDTRYARNRLRHLVLPTLEAGVPGFGDALVADIISQQESLEKDMEHVRSCWTQWHHDNQLELGQLLQEEDTTRYLFWRVLTLELGLPMTRGSLTRLDDLATGVPGRSYELGRLIFHRRGKDLVWEASQAPDNLPSVMVPCAEGVHQRGDSVLRVRIIDPPMDVFASPDEAFLDLAHVRGSLEWRGAQAGERWRPFGAFGRQSVFRYLAGRGVPERARRGHAVFADEDGVIWIPGHTIADLMQVTPKTEKVLHLTLDRAVRTNDFFEDEDSVEIYGPDL